MSTHPRARRFFLASCIALIVTAMSFAIRGDILASLISEFGLTSQEGGWVTGAAFIGFPLAMLIGGPLCDVLGMGRLMALAFVGHLLGAVLTIYAGGFWSLFLSTVLFGLGNGFVEAACNPLIATLYPQEKTAKLNAFHVWFPGGIVIGSLVAYGLDQMGMSWQVKMAALIPPAIVYAVMFWGMKFPQTERAAAGITDSQMYGALARPLFLFMGVCMVMTAATELGTNQWIPALLTDSAVAGSLVLAWISLLMAIGRMFAGPVVHRLAPTGVLLGSAVLSSLGLLWMSAVDGRMIFVASALFAAGICYFWPTMLGFIAEYLPRTGAVGLAAIGAIGAVATSIAQPFLGWVRDGQLLSRIPEGMAIEDFENAAAGTSAAARWVQIQAEAGAGALQTMAVVPAVLIVLFGALHLKMRNYQPEKL